MKNIGKKISNYLDKQIYLPDFFGILINPLFIVRYYLLKKLKKHFDKLNGKILDFGCGSSPYKPLIKYNEYVRVDFQNNIRVFKNAESVIFYDGEKLPFNDNVFDSILCTEVFEHIPNLEQIIKELHRVLKKNGKILISTPFVWNEHEIPNDYQRFSLYGLRLVLERNGFKVIHEEKTTKTFHTITQLITNSVHHAIFTRYFILNYFINLLVIFPINLIGWIVGFFWTDKYQRLPLNIVVLAKKL